jgi:hypothetical protein
VKLQAVQSWITSNQKNTLPYLLKRDLDPASNDNSPFGIDKAA